MFSEPVLIVRSAARIDSYLDTVLRLSHASTTQYNNDMTSTTIHMYLFLTGDDSGGDPPKPIPNLEVKPPNADGTAASGCGRVGHRQSSFQETPRLSHLGSLGVFLFVAHASVRVRRLRLESVGVAGVHRSRRRRSFSDGQSAALMDGRRRGREHREC